MNKHDRSCSLVFLGIAVTVCLGSLQHTVGTLSNPGPGLFPLLFGGLLGVLSITILAGGVMANRAAASPAEAVARVGLFSKEALLVVVCLIAYGAALLPLGFILTTFLVFAVIFRFVVDQSWAMSLGGAAALSVGAFVVFDILLKVSLPRGILGF